MTYRRWIRIALGYLALISLEIGVWAQFFPQSFYDNYPGLGRAWVAIDGPYNEHLVRDVGGLNLALAAVLIVALVTLSQTTIVGACVASLLYGVPHLVYHIAHSDLLDAGDVVASVGGLALFAALPVVVIVVSRRHSTAPPT